MTVRFATHEGQWTEAMKCAARDTVVAPLERQLGNFDISFHLNGPEMWTVLQSSDGSNHIVRSKDANFKKLLEAIERHLWQQIVHRPRKFFSLNPFRPFFTKEAAL